MPWTSRRLIVDVPRAAAPQDMASIRLRTAKRPATRGQSRLVFLYTDAPERSLDTLEFNLESGLPGAAILPLLWRPFYVRKTERFKAYVRGLGLVDYWKAKGWPSSAIPPPPTISSAIDELRPDNQALPLGQLMARLSRFLSL